MERVINPKTKKYINVDGPTYNKLLSEGYTKSYLNSLHKVEDLQLNLISDEPVQYNDDVLNTIIRYLPLNELFAMYHTDKHIRQLLNNKALLKDLGKNFDVEPTSFMDFIHQIIKDKYKYDMNDLHNNLLFDYKKRWYSGNVIKAYNIIYNSYKKGELISSCKTRRTTDIALCYAKQFLRKEYAKEIDLLAGAKLNNYSQYLNHLEYAIYYKLLSNI